ncbi:hypothetical protein Q3G72_012814 [Acer saccharum]|nr:hypothetical protein Q3G72_012814 [Acer saccharum]
MCIFLLRRAIGEAHSLLFVSKHRRKRRRLRSRQVLFNTEGETRKGGGGVWNPGPGLVFKEDLDRQGGNFVDSVHPSQRSFAEVVKRNLSQKVPSIKTEACFNMSWKSEKGVEEWLSRCAVGVLKKFANISSVSKRLSNKGISFSSSYIGDKSILYCFDSEIDKDSFLSNRFFWDDCFSSFSRWSEILIPQTRLAWIEVSRVPLHCWEASFFMKLGWLIGEPLLIDEDTVLRRRLDKGKMLVLIPHAKLSSWTVNVKMERAVVAVNLVEDKAPVCFKWLNEFFWFGFGRS